MDTDLVEAIRKAIRESGESLSHLAARCSVDKGIISRFLRGERTMTIETAQKVLTALGCAVKVEPVPRKGMRKPRKDR